MYSVLFKFYGQAGLWVINIKPEIVQHAKCCLNLQTNLPLSGRYGQAPGAQVSMFARNATGGLPFVNTTSTVLTNDLWRCV